MQNRNNIITTMLLALGFFALPQRTQATPLPGFNTADGQNALSSVTTGVANTGIGWFSLKSNTDGSKETCKRLSLTSKGRSKPLLRPCRE